MSTVASRPKPSSPPGDEELAALYNQVLIGFAEESPISEQASQRLPSPGEREYEPVYNRYSDNSGDTPRSTLPSPVRSPSQMCTFAEFPASTIDALNSKHLPFQLPKLVFLHLLDLCLSLPHRAGSGLYLRYLAKCNLPLRPHLLTTTRCTLLRPYQSLILIRNRTRTRP